MSRSFQNGLVGTSGNPLLQNSNENVFGTLEMIQKFADTNLRSICSRKLLSLVKNTDIRGLLTCPISIPLSLDQCSLENQQSHTHGKRP